MEQLQVGKVYEGLVGEEVKTFEVVEQATGKIENFYKVKWNDGTIEWHERFDLYSWIMSNSSEDIDVEMTLNPAERERRNRILSVMSEIIGNADKYGSSLLKSKLEALCVEDVQVIEDLHQKFNFDGNPTNDMHDEYLKICESNGYEGMDKIAFSRFIKKYFGMKIIDRKVNGVKRRLFEKI